MGYGQALTLERVRRTHARTRANTGNLLAVMDAMGHQSVDTTRIYNHSNVTLIREAIERSNQQLSETVQ